ncbi:tyrosine-type recombinase/integrase [Salmonella enterica]|uniref:Integrase/recombinase n=2 Tax=Salmonella enterica I TaxID=59201 RepID=A0A5Y0RSZ9_SALNE|nr:tyrosine-type recombinase/integrase [Salmonella enterica]EBR7996971.1 integrase/recombinase [Salmonella enterica subsp. enterica serovar Panama]EBS4088253.1 integrase/recombinase [Salmonella enterica subsp. enterica serovar Newport]ASD85473.1 integrase/recombinase [Salmonella enterica subsp. enterica serovar India str. SA20085604]ASD89060.1 integrase/recombinase [Salmonella enterica subsp. enterica serovar India str. SA20085604]EAW2935787.1 integrase/recombinase [Salmonella enterica]
MNAPLTLIDAVEAMVAQKRTVGYKYEAEEAILYRFVGFTRSQFPGLETITEASVNAWIDAAQKRTVTPATLQGLTSPVRHLARWLILHDVAAYVLPTGVLRRPAAYIPHIYSDAELAAFFSQTDRCRYCSDVPLRHLIMPVLFRTIYACGLRCSEGRLLRAEDVDLVTGVLLIRDAKGGKDRQIPVSEPLRVRLAHYHAQFDWMDHEWFFPGRRGHPLRLLNVYNNFRRFLWQARISHGGRGHGPRVHDFRHSFAVHNLRKWFATGKDVGAMLPILQTYMGHYSIADTAYYLRLTAESYPHIVMRLDETVGHVVPSLKGGLHHGN